MSYWSSDISGCDFASLSTGACIVHIKKMMYQDLKNVAEATYPEQSILALLACLRLIGGRFPKGVSVHFGRSNLEEVKVAFYEWYETSGDKIPKKYRDELLKNAELEFKLFEEQILKT